MYIYFNAIKLLIATKYFRQAFKNNRMSFYNHTANFTYFA